MRSVLFTREGSVYTLCTQPQMPTYLIKWQINPKEKAPPSWTPSQTQEVHSKPATSMKASRGGLISIMYGDGHVSLLEAHTLKETTQKRKVHTMPVTGVVFRDDEEVLITAGLDYKYCVLKNFYRAPMWHKLVDLMFYMGFLLVLLLYFAEWLV